MEFKAKVDLISERAIFDACTGSNPRQINKDQMKKIFECVYYGNKVEF
jgi:alcohol dehydrogenase class IV